MSTGYTDATNINKNDSQQSQGTEKTIYIGVFFDGTNNNKFQVTMGKYFRLKQDSESASMTAKNRLSFGSDSGTDMWFVEDSIHSADIYDLPYTLDGNLAKGKTGRGNVAEMTNEGSNNDVVKGKQLYENLLEAYKSGDSEKIKEGKGASAQDVETYTNVAILEALYAPSFCSSDDYFPLYIEGAGTDMNLTSSSLSVSRANGMMTGTGSAGVEAKVQKAISAIRNICYRYTALSTIDNLNIHISTYGFSRGATEARMFAYHTRDKSDLLKNLAGIEKVKEVVLDFVGLFDTVSSEGGNFSNDVDDLKLWGVNHATAVLHLCAMDEFRSNFALTDIENCIGSCGTELFMPGCHTDIGGGNSIGLENGITKINSEIEYTYYSVNVCTERHFMRLFNPSSEMKQVSVSTLNEMGWIDTSSFVNLDSVSSVSDEYIEKAGGAYKTDTVKIEAIHRNVQIRQYVKPGYSVIALHLMHSKAQKFFKTIPAGYQLPYDANNLLRACYDKWKGYINSNIRKIVSLSNEEYKALRRDYLHISMNDGIVGGHGATDNKIVNGPNFKKIANTSDKLIMRLVYTGAQGGGSRYMDEL